MNAKRRTIGYVERAGLGLFLICLLLSGPARAGNDPMKAPWNWTGREDSFSPQDRKSPRNLGSFLITVFQTHISPVDGRGCPMYPSCSQYGFQSFQTHGFLVGSVLTWDRLYRCGRDELRRSPPILIDGRFKCYDPLAHNDFWWHKK